jgi:polar amino acid transport system substrate-binding protein
MRKLVALLSVVALSIGAAACGGDDDDDDAGGSDSTTTVAEGGGDCSGPADAYNTEVGSAEDFTPITEDTLTIVTSLPGPGFWEGSDDDPTQVNAGLEYDMAQAMKEAFGLANLEVRNETFDAIVAGTVTDYDLALSQVSITCERAEVVEFTEPYFESNQGVLVAADSGVTVTSIEEAKAIKWGAQTGTTALDLLAELEPDEEPAVYQQLPDAYTALEADQVDAVLIDTAINLGQAARSGGRLEVVSQFEQPGGPDQYGGLLPEGTDDAGAINAVLQEMKSSGQLDELIAENLTTDPGNLPVITLE